MSTDQPTEDRSVEEPSQSVTDEQGKQEEPSTEEQSTVEKTDTTEETEAKVEAAAETNEQQTEEEVRDKPLTEPVGETPQEVRQDTGGEEEKTEVATEGESQQGAEGGETTEGEGATQETTRDEGGPRMSVVVIGGTGAIGRHLVAQLLKAKDKVGKVILIGRRKQEVVPEQYGVSIEEEEAQGRLVQHVEDMDAISSETIQGLCNGANVFYCTLGTTKSQAGSAAAFHHIDHDIPLKFIQAAKAVGVATCSLVTSMGANASSFLLYTRTKGELEEATRACEFPCALIYRPGLLGRDEKRFAEKVASVFFKEMPVATVAQAMINDSYKYFSSPPESGAANNFVISNNRAIYQSAEALKD